MGACAEALGASLNPGGRVRMVNAAVNEVPFGMVRFELLRLVLLRVGQRPFMLKHLS